MNDECRNVHRSSFIVGVVQSFVGLPGETEARRMGGHSVL
jgi:hypothetical protein